MSRIRIKDIAERAGVSVGTVDRVLHGRPNVSKAALESVNKALEDMNYRPNAYASALAHNKAYTFVMMLPKHNSEAYWHEIEEGARKFEERRSEMNVKVEFVYYHRLEDANFHEMGRKVLGMQPDGVVIIPSEAESTREFSRRLSDQHIPLVLLDSNMPELKPLAFFGQDSIASGAFAAKILLMQAHGEKRVALVRQVYNGALLSNQTSCREKGIRQYMADYSPETELVSLDLPQAETKKRYFELLDKFFEENPDIHNLITVNSKAFIVGEYLLEHNKRDVQIMGYDMVPKNRACLKQGSISFIICQHGYQQGYGCMEALFRAVVLKLKVEPTNYMPIDLITKENYKYYQREQL